ncbi:MAG: hypothetical protein A2827_03435 [Candidatus Spechtbacteria bacterium RIFCSPHIGHO2_01_FULL_43_30]|uniref:Uncharacterized protein n=1 Tax=Candidatus Spechtbacteria bacterium RIFCSPHIGHO2_01_FULL_43_30 TaxID=1802158 RepID=A0A1G2H876_9BACT|nr:MAG: hypothetical protein A2827_03435 [Candidatus Spechtbacteria bacterium RIFCSPHIGHO2_01_FULL_43_30]
MEFKEKKSLIISATLFSGFLAIVFLIATFNRFDIFTNNRSFEKLPDSDKDGLYDIEEKKFYETDPLKPDTDDDGLNDIEEVEVYFTDPNNKYINPATGLTDKEMIESGYDPISAELITADKKAALDSRILQITVKFPDEYLLLESETPAGFVLKDVTEKEASQYDATGNPGFYGLNDEASENLTFGYLYAKSDDPESELGVFVIKYYFPSEISDAYIQEEWKKIYNTDPKILLRKGNILVYIWSDTPNYLPYMNTLADALKKRLDLERLE